MRKLLLVFSLALLCEVRSQTPVIDSLKRVLLFSKADMQRVKDLNELAWQYIDYSTDSAGKYVAKALALASALNYSDGIVDAKNSLGILYRYSGQTQKAIELYSEVIRMRSEQKRFDKLTGAFANLGSVYYDAGDAPNALKYYLRAYNNAEKLQQSEAQISLLNNLGNAYKSSGLINEAITAFQKGLTLNKTQDSPLQTGLFYANLATVYDDQNLPAEALKYSKEAYAIFKKENNIRFLSSTVNNLSLYSRHLGDFKATEQYLEEMRTLAQDLDEAEYHILYFQSKANLYFETGNFLLALKAIDSALNLGDSLQNSALSGTSHLIKASILFRLKQFKEALAFYDKGITVVNDKEDKNHLIRAYRGKSEVLQSMGDYKSALAYYQQATVMEDSLNTADYLTKIAALNAVNELDKKDKELQLSIKERESAEAKNKQQSVFLKASVLVAVLILGLLLMSIRAYRVKKKDNILLNTQKEEISLKNQRLHEQTLEIQNQMVLVEEKQKEILDSIHYARRIQRALLTDEKMIRRHVADSFILFKPKDIVSGDFYWASERNNKLYFAVCDSTGHGVPGAFMSLLNISFLNEAVNEKNIEKPNEILDHVRKKLIENISQEGAKDGMDTILICYDSSERKLSFSAANNKPVLLRANVLQELPTDKMPVGLGEHLRPFSLHELEVQSGDVLYMYSDGYADQFGGPNGKKFKYRPLNELLSATGHLSLEEQLRVLNARFEEWRGQLEQVDDVLLAGIRF